MNVILCGFHWTGCKALEILRAHNVNVYVYTHLTPWHIPSLPEYCERENIPYTTEKIEINNLPFQPDVICSIYYRYIISKEVIDVVNGKIFNLHPSLLPKYRGCSSVTWALINNEKKYGYTYHFIEPTCDTGNIILQKALLIEPWDTQQSLFYKVMFESMKDFFDVLIRVLDGETGSPQIGESSFYLRGCPHDGKINDKWSLEYIERFIRAMYFPPYPCATYKDREIHSMQEYLKISTTPPPLKIFISLINSINIISPNVYLGNALTLGKGNFIGHNAVLDHYVKLGIIQLLIMVPFLIMYVKLKILLWRKL